MKDIFFLYLDYPATGPGFVLQLFPSLCFFFFVLFLLHMARMHVHILVHGIAAVCVSLCRPEWSWFCSSSSLQWNRLHCINSSVCYREHMAPYSIPTGLLLVEEMPRNHMGKVNKKDLLRRFFSWPDCFHMTTSRLGTKSGQLFHQMDKLNVVSKSQTFLKLY